MPRQPSLVNSLIVTQAFFIFIYVIVFFVSGPSALTMILVINVIFIIAIVVTMRNQKKMMKKININYDDLEMMKEARKTPGFDPRDFNTFPPEIQKKILESQGVNYPYNMGPMTNDPMGQPTSDRNAQRTDVNEPPKYETRTDDAVKQSSDRIDQKIEIRCVSEIPNTSFAFAVDGRICGYIGTAPSTFDVPAGMHQVQIMTNDVERKMAFEKNVMFNTKKRFTVKKKIGGYTVKIE